MAPGKPKIATRRSPGRPRKVGRGFGKFVASNVAKPTNNITPAALRSGKVVTPSDSRKAVGDIDKGAPNSTETPIKRGRGRPKKNLDVEMAVNGLVADGATNGETEAVEEVENVKAAEDIAVPTPEVKRGRGRPKKIVSQVSSKDVLAAALATASASSKSDEGEDDSADELEAETGPAAAGTKRGRGRPKKEGNLVTGLAPSSSAAPNVAPIKRGKGRPLKKKRLSYFGRPVPAVPSDALVLADGQDGEDSVLVNADSESSGTSSDGEVDDVLAAAAFLEAVAPKLLPSLLPPSARLSLSPSHGGIAVAQELGPNAAHLDAEKPRYHGIFKGKAGEELAELAPDHGGEVARSGRLTPYGNEGAVAGANKADTSVEAPVLHRAQALRAACAQQ